MAKCGDDERDGAFDSFGSGIAIMICVLAVAHGGGRARQPESMSVSKSVTTFCRTALDERRYGREQTYLNLDPVGRRREEDEITHILSVCRWYEYQTRQANSHRCGWRPVS